MKKIVNLNYARKIKWLSFLFYLTGGSIFTFAVLTNMDYWMNDGCLQDINCIMNLAFGFLYVGVLYALPCYFLYSFYISGFPSPTRTNKVIIHVMTMLTMFPIVLGFIFAGGLVIGVWLILALVIYYIWKRIASRLKNHTPKNLYER
ncbi:MAG: hypothetical protein IIA45_09495 [Bacteroidetes bacterium]|nr:hypothetical protein [Bacteroidota bacterium]